MSSKLNIDEKVFDRTQLFLDWLRDNGAEFSKIKWPTDDTESGIRGAVALEDINTNEPMIQIPSNLMISPPNIYADPVIGGPVKSLVSLNDDLLIVVYLIYEMNKGVESFYFPYLNILPETDNISEWSSDQLQELQDERLIVRARNRENMMRTLHKKLFSSLTLKLPEIFTESNFSFEKFKFCWNTIQARAFGRRLPWTALVPFADCLNHSNVQTKYDYKVGADSTEATAEDFDHQQAVFRLFPSGTNRYSKGHEVFNSYGRRPNENLLMDYGFALEKNEWDEVTIPISLDPEDANFSFKSDLAYRCGLQSSNIFRLNELEIPFKPMVLLRIYCSHNEDLFKFEEMLNNFLMEYRREQINQDSLGKIETSQQRDRLMGRIISIDNELKCISKMKALLQSHIESMPTTLDEDLSLKQKLVSMRSNPQRPEIFKNMKLFYDSSDYWRYLNAITYRITQKKISMQIIDNLNTLFEHFTKVQEYRSKSVGSRASDEVIPPDFHREFMNKMEDVKRLATRNVEKHSHFYISRLDLYLKDIQLQMI